MDLNDLAGLTADLPMNIKFLNLGLVIASLIGYLEWGGGNTSFLFEAEAEVVKKLVTDPLAGAHAFTIIPLIGQVVLLATIFQKRPSSVLTILGIACLGLLLGFISFIGIITQSIKVFISTVPFLFLAAFTLYSLWRRRKLRGPDIDNAERA